jgi:hypothetical protein
MTKVDITRIAEIIKQAGKNARIPSENIEQAVVWANKNYADLEIKKLEERMHNIFLRKYENAVDKVLESDPVLKRFLKKQHPNLEQKIATNLAYGSLAAIAYRATDYRTYGDYVKTFGQEAVLFGMPGSSAEFLDEVDEFLGRK